MSIFNFSQSKNNILKNKNIIYLIIVTIINLIGIGYYLTFFNSNLYLPAPFIFDKSDTFMDFFNVLYWAYEDGRYTEWGSVYPPLNFIILKAINFIFFGVGQGDVDYVRSNSQFVILGIVFFYLISPYFIINTNIWKIFTKWEKFFIYIIIISSSPMLFSLERANLIIITPLILSFCISKIGWQRAFFLGILINIKPYFVVMLLYYFARKNWLGLRSCILFSSLIFLISGLFLDENFLFFLKNILSFAQEEEVFSLRELVAFPSSISAFSLLLLRLGEGNVLLNSYLLEYQSTIKIIIELIKWLVLAFSLYVIFLKGKFIRDSELFFILITIISNLGVWVGGYTFILYYTIIPVIYNLRFKWVYLFFILTITLPIDFVSLVSEVSDDFGKQFSFLGNQYVETIWTVGPGSIARPIFNIFLLFLLSFEYFSRSEVNSNLNRLLPTMR